MTFMLMFDDTPGVQVRPEAIAIEEDHSPEAQRWKELPSEEQAQAPSWSQGPLSAPTALVGGVELVPVAAGAGGEAAVEATGSGETVAVPAAAEAAPGLEAAAEAAGGDETTAVSVAAEVAPD